MAETTCYLLARTMLSQNSLNFLNFGMRKVSGKLDGYDFSVISRVSGILSTKLAFLRQLLIDYPDLENPPPNYRDAAEL